MTEITEQDMALADEFAVTTYLVVDDCDDNFDNDYDFPQPPGWYYTVSHMLPGGHGPFLRAEGPFEQERQAACAAVALCKQLRADDIAIASKDWSQSDVRPLMWTAEYAAARAAGLSHP